MGDVTVLLGRQGIPSGVDPAEAREAAREILSRPEYAEPQPSVVERAGEWVLDRIGSFFGTLTGGGPGSVVGWLVLTALVLGATWMIARALQVPAPGGTGGGPRLRYGTETRRDAGEWLAEATRLAAAGDLRGALRCRYQALLATVVTERVVDDVPGRTSGEYRRLLRERLPDHADAIDAVTEAFEATWYGGAAVDHATWQAVERDSAAVEDAARRQAVPA